MIIGTAGHVDHGKSALARALTGREMDRLVEERRRGITIELGFAPLQLPDGRVAGLVDVPGHEDLVRTMVAGASGIDVVLLVIDAQQGIQPQTEEHLAVVEALGIPAGIPVLSKSDLVEPEWLALVGEEVIARLRRSAVAFAEPVVTSVLRGDGIEALRERIASVLATVPSRRSNADLFRMPVDRAFPVAGAGTVVTGTVWSGTLGIGDIVRFRPGHLTGRVRTLEQFGQSVERAEPGARTAIGLAGVSHADVHRGQVAVRDEDPWEDVRAVDAILQLLPEAPRALGPRARIRVLAGTAEVMARVVSREPLAPGGSALARLRLEAPLLLRGGDRLVLRSYSPVQTIGGGWVVDPAPPRRAGWPEGLGAPDPAQRLAALIARQPAGRDLSQLPGLLGLPAKATNPLVTGDPALVVVAGRVLLAATLEEAAQRLEATLGRFHREQPSQPGLSVETLRQSLGGLAWLADATLDRLVSRGRMRVANGVVSMVGHAPASAGGAGEVDRLVAHLDAAGLEAPSTSELAPLGLKDLVGALRIAVQRGLVEAVERDRHFSTSALATFRAGLEAVGQGGAEVTPAALRDRLGLTRKYLIPLLEWADRQGITWRDHTGVRRLRKPTK